jgi:hypothetical protein
VTTEDSSIAIDRKAPTLPGDTLAQTVASLSDAELREFAGAVLSELRARVPNSGSQGFSYRHLVSDLQRRLADAHTYAQSGFGKRDRNRPAAAAGLRLSPLSAPLSEERKARLLIGLEAELVPAAGAATTTADQPGEPTARALDAPGNASSRESSVSVQPSNPTAAFEAEIWQALQTGVGRSAAPPPATKEDRRRR